MQKLNKLELFYKTLIGKNTSLANQVASDCVKLLEDPSSLSNQRARDYFTSKLNAVLHSQFVISCMSEEDREIVRSLLSSDDLFQKALDEENQTRPQFLLTLQNVKSTFNAVKPAILPVQPNRIAGDDQISTLFQFGKLCLERGDYVSAAKIYDKIIIEIENCKDKDEYHTSKRLAEDLSIFSHFKAANQLDNQPYNMNLIISHLLSAMKILQLRNYKIVEIAIGTVDIAQIQQKLGECYFRLGVYQAAEKYYRDVTQYLDTYYDRQILLNSLEDPGSVILLARHHDAHNGLANTYYKLGNFNAGFAEVELVANTFAKLGDLNGAIAELEIFEYLINTHMIQIAVDVDQLSFRACEILLYRCLDAKFIYLSLLKDSLVQNKNYSDLIPQLIKLSECLNRLYTLTDNDDQQKDIVERRIILARSAYGFAKLFAFYGNISGNIITFGINEYQSILDNCKEILSNEQINKILDGMESLESLDFKFLLTFFNTSHKKHQRTLDEEAVETLSKIRRV